ncbi:MAG: GGDEF domain-containing protein [Chakrabartia sp.]
MRVESQRQVLYYTLLVTAVAVAAPLLVVFCVLSMIPHIPMIVLIPALLMAGLIPLLIAPPIAYSGLTMLKMLTLTIDKVDSQTKFDGLTGALNRDHFLDSVRSRKTSGVIMIVDADHFKSINDQYGHAAGDEALMILANAMALCIGQNGFVGRLGGEEFGIFLPNKTAAYGFSIADEVCTSIRNLRPLIDGKSIPLTVSIGGAFHKKTALVGITLKEADERLYHAKATGRDRAIFTHIPKALLRA